MLRTNKKKFLPNDSFIKFQILIMINKIMRYTVYICSLFTFSWRVIVQTCLRKKCIQTFLRLLLRYFFYMCINSERWESVRRAILSFSLLPSFFIGHSMYRKTFVRRMQYSLKFYQLPTRSYVSWLIVETIKSNCQHSKLLSCFFHILFIM